MKKSILSAFSLMLLIIFAQACSETDSVIFGKWKLNLEKSTDIAPWRYRQLELEIVQNENELQLIHNWKHRRHGDWVDTLKLVPGGDTVKSIIRSPHWVENWFMGVLSKENSVRTTVGEWEKPGKYLKTSTEQMVEISQGETNIRTYRSYQISRYGNELTVIEKRSSRPAEIRLVFDRITE
ncbi:MAG: hypothetical protein SCK70_02215 [bacterium]|nr:hypothetical protein [bacterium]